MNLLLESMTPVTVGPYSVRLWREEMLPLLDDKRHAFDKSEIMRVANGLSGDEGPLKIARTFIALPRMNAVEVLDPERHGIVLYRDWP